MNKVQKQFIMNIIAKYSNPYTIPNSVRDILEDRYIDKHKYLNEILKFELGEKVVTNLLTYMSNIRYHIRYSRDFKVMALREYPIPEDIARSIMRKGYDDNHTELKSYRKYAELICKIHAKTFIEN